MNSTLTMVASADYRLGFTSLEQEVRVEALPIDGRLPDWLTGTLLRNGPARFSVGRERYRHWFDGLAMVHRFSLGGGRVGYANRFLRTPAFLAAERSGRIARSEFATDPQPALLDRIGVRLRAGASDNANVNVVPFGGEYLALTETPAVVAFDGESLATRGVRGYDDDVKGQITTAHTLHDPVRHATFNVVIEVGRVSKYHVVRIDDGTLRRTAVGSVATDAPAYLHAFSLTERYVVIVEYPLVVNPLSLLFRRKPFIDNYRWKPERGTRLHVLDKDSGAHTGTYETDAFFAFHHINAFEERDTIVLDLCAYADAGIVDDFRLERLTAADPPRVARPAFHRFRLVPGQAAARAERIGDAGIELPRIAPRCAGRPYGFAYGIDNAGAAPIFDRIVKVDVSARSTVGWSAPDAYVGEPIFVARPGGVDEDDGVLLAVVLDAAAGVSSLLVLDARTLGTIARATAPHHIPFGFHGLFAGPA